MKKQSFKWFGYLFSFAFIIISCAGTDLKQNQVDDAYKGEPVSDILVIAITGNEHNRRSFERKFVGQLKSLGVDAVSSEKAIPMPGDLQITREMILNAVKQYENDAVIITQLIGKEQKDVDSRGGSRRGGLYGFHGIRFGHGYNSTYSSTNTTVRLETNLYEVKTEKLIWSGKTKSFSRDSTDQIIKDVIKTVISNLQKNKLIAPK